MLQRIESTAYLFFWTFYKQKDLRVIKMVYLQGDLIPVVILSWVIQHHCHDCFTYFFTKLNSVVLNVEMTLTIQFPTAQKISTTNTNI